jgi:hypothetical protein
MQLDSDVCRRVRWSDGGGRKEGVVNVMGV